MPEPDRHLAAGTRALLSQIARVIGDEDYSQVRRVQEVVYKFLEQWEGYRTMQVQDLERQLMELVKLPLAGPVVFPTKKHPCG